ncbi:DNA replication licensing factor Mcm2 [Arabidopsis thaliana x Arabidopsis arenosa]|uniref:DNA replication licensing factor Mcm2 n=1 Tax=Arabidopsis thaliana x Arabidopsis arenosa TaxID=1240361 RepID=A0A8T2GNF5_9BRAS|nr:DNA replication licensing factor Mcm2 [Arabidopsis thaliana x Arabidopsis arenosa]
MEGDDIENNQPSVINIDDEEEGEDLFNDNYMKDYKLMDGNGQDADAAKEEEVVMQITRDEHDEKEEDGEDLFNDNFLDDYRQMDGHE